jgi:hypothetical protein
MGIPLENFNTPLPYAAAMIGPDGAARREALSRLMAADYDPTGMSDDDLVAAAIQAREAKRRAETAVAAELMRRHWTWRRIGQALGVDHTTAYGWVRDAGLLPRDGAEGE